MKKTIIMLLCLAMTAMCFCGCGNNPENTQALPEQSVETDSPVETTVTNEEEVTEEEDSGSDILGNTNIPVGVFEVETPYCMLTYPLTFQNNLAIEQTDFDNKHIVSFYAVIEGKENQQVFDVVFSADSEGNGDFVGQIEAEEGTISVFFKTYSVYENEGLSYDEEEMLMAMIEDINVVYNGLSVLENFS